MGELSEFAPYDDSCEPLATEEEAADYNERVHREEEEEQQFQRRYSSKTLTTESSPSMMLVSSLCDGILRKTSLFQS